MLRSGPTPAVGLLVLRSGPTPAVGSLVLRYGPTPAVGSLVLRYGPTPAVGSLVCFRGSRGAVSAAPAVRCCQRFGPTPAVLCCRHLWWAVGPFLAFLSLNLSFAICTASIRQHAALACRSFRLQLRPELRYVSAGVPAVLPHHMAKRTFSLRYEARNVSNNISHIRAIIRAGYHDTMIIVRSVQYCNLRS